MGQLTNSSQLFILSGAREIGKTTLIMRLLEQARRLKIQAAGVLSPAVYENGIKTGIDLIDVKTGIHKNLAILRQAGEGGIFTDHWTFLTESLNWGNEVLGESTPCDLLIVDELGPIELEQTQGLQNGISAINSRKYRAAVVVIRPELLTAAIVIWPDSQLVKINEKSDREFDFVIKKILASLK
jgi:nucleoside-triphosphatase